MKWLDNWLLKTYGPRIAGLEAARLRSTFKPYATELVFADQNGKRYYRVTGEMQPLERIGKAQDFLTMMASGLTDEELGMLIAVIDNELAKGMAGQKVEFKKMGAALSEISTRKNMILHSELLYNFLAVHYIREDEPANEWIESIHYEKVRQFKKENKGNSTYFFFQVPELKLINGLLRASESEWNEFWQDSLTEQERLKRKVSYLLSEVKSTLGKTTGAQS